VAELIPDVVKVTGASAVIAAVDNEAWLPRGLARQLRGWLERMGVVCATPKPLCSLTETDYGMARRQRMPYEDSLISEFARYFGQPDLRLSVDASSKTITGVEVARDAVWVRAFRRRTPGGGIRRRRGAASEPAAPPLPLSG